MGQNKIDESFKLDQALANNTVGSVGSIFSIKPVAKYFTGARCVLKVNNEIVAFATGISWSIQTAVEEILTVDSYMPYELAPSRIEVSGTISGFRIPGKGPNILGYERNGFFDFGDAAPKLLQSDFVSFLHQKYITIEVIDSQSDNLIFRTNKAMVTRRSESVRTGSMAELSLEFRAIGFVDERNSPTAPWLK